MKRAPKKWVDNACKKLHKVYADQGTKVSLKKCRTIVKETWKHGLKNKCRVKIQKRYRGK